MLAAGALLTAEKVIHKGELWTGRPAKFWRNLSEIDTYELNLRSAQYVELANEYKKAV
jgi:carbonic anhydrase/acetyltransferase-like protein (isoleucine patch superfamily)